MMMKEGLLLLLFFACVASQCSVTNAGSLNCPACLRRGCKFCNGTCTNTANCPNGVTPTTTCEPLCSTVPDSDKCIYGPNHQVINSNAGGCVFRNSAFETFKDINSDPRNPCRVAWERDGPKCFFALQTWKCTFQCGTCPDQDRVETIAPFTAAKVCPSVCNEVASKCPTAFSPSSQCGQESWFWPTCDNSTGCATIVRAVENPAVYYEVSQLPPGVTGPGDSSSGLQTPIDLWKILVGVIIGIVVVVIAVVVLSIFLVKKRRGPKMKSQLQQRYSDVELSPSPSSGNLITYSPIASKPSVRTFAETSIDPKWNINYNEITIVKEIGQGEFGVVYQGLWRNAKVVMKTVKLSTDQAVADFYKEIQNLTKLRPHPNVCTFLGMCSDPLCIVTELVVKGSLDELLADSHFKLDLKLAIDMCTNVATGLNHIHYENILHCDLAARNLLVTEQLTLKVADFGMSRLTNSGVYEVGREKNFPVRWTSPETLTNRTFTKASDIWSLGIVMWEILERKYPYHRWDNQTVLTEVLENHYRLPRPTTLLIPDKLWAMMLQCWAEDPYERPTASLSLIHI
eukprot:TRINITY_DN2006_c0_g1_i2.p1 TRINITY_DN2006_c0_g1~~TRINITY_DN2006_c0_g1_i2.p1  ORF type:complete len:570 (+),score=96.57 TRINITY_DN2006_c0_g1_i2:39-1748(+)